MTLTSASAIINDSTWVGIEDVAEVVDMVLGHKIEPEEIIDKQDKNKKYIQTNPHYQKTNLLTQDYQKI